MFSHTTMKESLCCEDNTQLHNFITCYDKFEHNLEIVKPANTVSTQPL